MALRTTARSMRRFLSATPRANAPDKLPFEKPIFESEILRKAQQDDASYKRLRLIGNTAVILAGVSLLARIGYYMMYGKESGALPLPRRSEK